MGGAACAEGGRTAGQAGVRAEPAEVEGSVQVSAVDAVLADSPRTLDAGEGDGGAGVGGDAEVEVQGEAGFAGVAGDSEAGGAVG